MLTPPPPLAGKESLRQHYYRLLPLIFLLLPSREAVTQGETALPAASQATPAFSLSSLPPPTTATTTAALASEVPTTTLTEAEALSLTSLPQHLLEFIAEQMGGQDRAKWSCTNRSVHAAVSHFYNNPELIRRRSEPNHPLRGLFGRFDDFMTHRARHWQRFVRADCRTEQELHRWLSYLMRDEAQAFHKLHLVLSNLWRPTAPTETLSLLKKCSSVTHLSLDFSVANREALAAIAPYLPPSLLTLELRHLGLQGTDLRALGSHLPAHLTTLDLSHNPLTLAGLAALTEHYPASLSTLRLRRTHLGRRNAQPVSFHFPATLRTLDLSGNDLNEQTAATLGSELPPQLRQLDLSDNPLNGQAMRIFSHHWPAGLTDLNLSNNALNDEVAPFLTQAHLPLTLTRLNLRGNRQLSDYAKALIRRGLPQSCEILF